MIDHGALPHIPEQPEDLFPDLPQTKLEKYGTTLELRIEKNDKTAAVGKLFAEAGRAIATLVTNQWAIRKGTYAVDITLTMIKVD